ncbi:MAG: hypothetical protein ACRC1H_10310 [Caldilineaceae bacterium]
MANAQAGTTVRHLLPFLPLRFLAAIAPLRQSSLLFMVVSGLFEM